MSYAEDIMNGVLDADEETAEVCQELMDDMMYGDDDD